MPRPHAPTLAPTSAPATARLPAALPLAAILVGGVIALPASTLAAGTTPILPGYWESTDTVISPIQQTKTSRKCITKDQFESYMTGPVNNHYRCHYTDQKVTDGNFVMSGDCVDSSGLPAKVALRGVYTQTSFQATARVRILIGGLPIPVTASTDAHRISADCPAPGAPAPGAAPPSPSTAAPDPSDSPAQ